MKDGVREKNDGSKKEGGTEESERREGDKNNITLQLKCIVNTNTATASCKNALKGIQRDIIS